MIPSLSRKALSAAVLLSVTPLAEAGIMRPDIDVLNYRDYALNMGVFQPGATNVTVYKKDGTVDGVIAVMPDFGALNDGEGTVTMFNPSFGGSVAHVLATTVTTYVGRYNNTGLPYSIFGDHYRQVANINMPGFDYKIMRYSKIFIDAAPATLMTDETYIAGMTGKQITRVGGGIQAVATSYGHQVDAYPGGNNYAWQTGGFNKVVSESVGTSTQTVGGVTGTYKNYILQIRTDEVQDSTLEIGVQTGDSGSPVFAWNTNTNRYELIAFTAAAGGTTAGYGAYGYLHSAPGWSVAQMNTYVDPTIVDAAGGVITMSGTDATGLGTLTQGSTVWNFHGLAAGLTSATATDAQLNVGKNLVFSGAGNILRLTAANTDLGAGSMTFTGGGTYTLDDDGVTTRRLNSAGYIVEAGTTLVSKITGSAGDDWRKLGTGTLRIEGSGANSANLSLGEGLVELNRTGGAAVADVLITSGRGTVRLLGDNQISGAVVFGRRGGTLDLYGHNFSRDVIYAMDGGAEITNTAANTTSTLTWTGSGAGAEQTFRGGFSDGGSLANGLLHVVINPTTPTGAVLTLTGISSNAGGFSINGGEVVLRGQATQHAANIVVPDDWTYAGISTGTIAVASDAKFTLADHARLDGDVTVADGGTFAITENLFKSGDEAVSGGLFGTPSASLYGHQSGTVTLSGANSAMIATVSGNTDQSVVYTRDITGAGSFTKNGAGTLTLTGTNTFSGTKTLNAGTLIGDSLASLGDTTVNKWSMNSDSTVIAAGGATAAQLKAKIATGALGTLALAGTNPDDAPDLTGYANLSLGAIGAQSVGTVGTSATLTAWNGGGWNLGGGGGTLTMNLKLSGAGTLTVGNGSNTGVVVLTNAHNNDTVGGAAFTGAINLTQGVSLRFTDINALGDLAGGDRITVAYGAHFSIGTGADAVSVLNAVTTGSTGVLCISGSDTNDYSLAAQGLDSAVIGADGTATYSGTLTPGSNGYRFGGSGDLTVASTLSGSHALSVDGQGTKGGVTTLSGNNTFAGAVTVQEGTLNGILGSHTLRLGSDGALGSGNAVAIGEGGVIDLNGKTSVFGALSGTSGGSLINSSATASTLTLDQSSNSTFAGAISGNGSLNLVKTGSGVLTLSGNNTNAGTYTVNAGVLRLGSATALGKSTNAVTVASGGTLDFAGKSATGNPLTISGTGSGSLGALHNSAAGTTVGTGAITLSGDATISGLGTTSVYTTGTINLAGNTLTVTNARLNTNDNRFTNGNLTGGSNSLVFITGTQTGAGSTGNFTLNTGAEFAVRDYDNTALTNTKTIVLNGGKISNGNVDNGGAAQSTIDNAIVVNAGGGSIVANNSTVGRDLRFTGALSGSGVLAIGGARATEFQGDTSGYTGAIAIASGSRLTMNGTVNQSLTGVISGAGALTKTGSTTLTLTGANTYTGGTTVSSGTLVAANTTALGSGALAVNGGILDLNAGAVTTGAVSINGGAIQNGTLTGTSYSTTSGTVSAGLAGSGSLVKTGSGSTTLSGNNTYTGGTTVSGGYLTFANTGAVPTTGSITVTGNGSLVASGAQTTVQGWLTSGKLAAGSTGSIAITGDSSENINFTGYNSLGLSSTGSATYSGTITAGTNGYVFGGDTATNLTVTSVLSGTSTKLTKNGAGTLTLTAANTYTGTTTIAAGTLALSGGDNRLVTTGTVAFSGAGTLDIGSTNQSLAAITVANGVTGTINGNGGTLTLANAPTLSATGSGTTLNMSGLTNLAFNNSAATFSVVTFGGSSAGQTALMKLAKNNSITAAGLIVGDDAISANTNPNTGQLELGQTNVINANTITVGKTRTSGRMLFQSGLQPAPTLKIRGTNGGDSDRANIDVGDIFSGGQASTRNSIIDVSGGVLDAKVGEMNIAYNRRNSTTTPNTGTFKMGAGTLDALTINVARDVSGSGTAQAITGTLAINGGTVKVGTLTMGTRFFNTLSATVTLDGGATLAAQTIQAGAGVATRTFTWNDGTIKNYDASTDLTIASGLTTFNVAGSGTHAFDIGSGRSGTVNQVMSGAGALTKLGDGTATFNGANTYAGGTTVSAGKLVAGHNNAFGTGAVTVSGTGILNVGLAGSGRTLANAITVNAGGTLMGAATLTGAVTINSGATLSPGNSPGTLTFNNGVTLASGASYLWEITGAAPSVAGTDFDQIVVTGGNLNINSGAALKIAALGIDYAGSFWDSDHSFTLATKSGTGTITGSFGTIDTSLAGAFSAEGSWSLLTAGNGDIQALWTAGSGMQGMSLQAIPEPSTYGLLGAGALAAVALVRRRKAKAA